MRVWEGEKSGAMDGRRSEVEVEREGDVIGELVSRVGERVRVNGRHWRRFGTFLGFCFFFFFPGRVAEFSGKMNNCERFPFFFPLLFLGFLFGDSQE